MEISYFKVPMSNIPFKEILSLENLNYKYIYCSYFPLKDFKCLDYYMLSVYDSFDEILIESDIEQQKLLFGSVVSEWPILRGSDKAIKVKSIQRVIDKKNLPHLKYSNNDLPDGNWFYMKDGDYFLISGIKSSFSAVNHLEGIAIYADNILRLRVVVELLKRNIRNNKVSLSESDFKEIGFKVLRSESSTKKIDDEDIRDAVNNWLPSMLSMPLLDEIPKEYRGRVKEI